ncbi:hypothetical protein F0562_026474 [Nyssa sinensis]|uniref:Uncharacterized protein n=1 Tax=Nyssa sinensis TaxID=561372 RepID=A0A5J5BD08_9ASTE|nr:hypothetical protein F0562_026474 [Nyssa sinensis]
MRRSFGIGGNQRMGGGGGGGGREGMLRTVHRVVRAGVGGAAQEPFSHSTASTAATSTRPTYKPTTSSTLSLSSSNTSSPFSSFNLPISATSTGPTWPSCSSPTYSDEFEWECVDVISEDERAHGFHDDFVFGTVPSRDEVQHAVSALQQVLDPPSFPQFIKDRLAYNSDEEVASGQITSPTGLAHTVPSVGSEIDWIEPYLQMHNPRMLEPQGSDRVYDAFHLLQTEPSVQRMVMSLSSDKAVWDAVLNNEVVRELRESLHEADNSVHGSSDGSSDDLNAATSILSRILDNTKAKMMELIDKITKLVNELFQSPDSEKTTGEDTDPFEGKLRTSFLLSIMVLLIVVVTRAHRA